MIFRILYFGTEHVLKVNEDIWRDYYLFIIILFFSKIALGTRGPLEIFINNEA